jgi:hypothetical protein
MSQYLHTENMSVVQDADEELMPVMFSKKIIYSNVSTNNGPAVVRPRAKQSVIVKKLQEIENINTISTRWATAQVRITSK